MLRSTQDLIDSGIFGNLCRWVKEKPGRYTVNPFDIGIPSEPATVIASLPAPEEPYVGSQTLKIITDLLKELTAAGNQTEAYTEKMLLEVIIPTLIREVQEHYSTLPL